LNTSIDAVAAALNAETNGDGSGSVSDVTHDSRQARAGTLFVAIKGLTMDGHRFVDDVMRRGAVGVISEYDPPSGFAGSWLKVKDARLALAKAASVINGDPSHKLDLIGITGTNARPRPPICVSLWRKLQRSSPRCSRPLNTESAKKVRKRFGRRPRLLTQIDSCVRQLMRVQDGCNGGIVTGHRSASL
jgi:hypothetical protein